ncbi:unnamed protein product [Prunus armeniaca]|uniref:Uncharacterized protein n=1 Tax=Prunus armeniaca TaxID=36596 RepID=A0A6J5ULD3_PRUAR|nr:unnamed protein product [Prunus armeniaca]
MMGVLLIEPRRCIGLSRVRPGRENSLIMCNGALGLEVINKWTIMELGRVVLKRINVKQGKNRLLAAVTRLKQLIAVETEPVCSPVLGLGWGEAT